jgi:hypothetical protein
MFVTKIKQTCVVLLVLWAAAWAQTDAPAKEQGAFNLHKFEQLIGKETYVLTREEGSIKLEDNFKFVDRGSEVPLVTTLVMEQDLTPSDFRIKGKISRPPGGVAQAGHPRPDLGHGVSLV